MSQRKGDQSLPRYCGLLSSLDQIVCRDRGAFPPPFFLRKEAARDWGETQAKAVEASQSLRLESRTIALARGERTMRSGRGMISKGRTGTTGLLYEDDLC